LVLHSKLIMAKHARNHQATPSLHGETATRCRTRPAPPKLEGTLAVFRKNFLAALRLCAGSNNFMSTLNCREQQTCHTRKDLRISTEHMKAGGDPVKPPLYPRSRPLFGTFMV
jgi:hypothetical protein